MPFVPTVATIDIAIGLTAVLHIGSGAIKLAKGVADGVAQWITGVPVITSDSGSVGVGAGLMPLIIPPPPIAAGLTLGFAAHGVIGVMSPLTITGLSVGLSLAFSKAVLISVHPGVGSGACVISFGKHSAIEPMIQGFKQNDMTTEGSIKMAKAIGMGLDSTFSIFQAQCPITGAPGPSPASGKGFGFIK